jgi:opacity protein-like surface antigen
MLHLKRILAGAALAALAGIPALAADCAQPGPAPMIPDGTTASVDQMKAAHDQVQSYANLLQSYQDCVEARIKMAPKDMKPEDKQKLRDAGNAAIDQATALRDSYAAQVKAFKARPK